MQTLPLLYVESQMQITALNLESHLESNYALGQRS